MAKSAFMSLKAWEKGFKLACSISKMARVRFPPEEKYSLTDQIRRSSRSVCSNLAEGYAKRCYPKHFRSKITDAIGENYETQNWLFFAHSEGYITQDMLEQYQSASEEVGKLLSSMEKYPEPFLRKSE